MILRFSWDIAFTSDFLRFYAPRLASVHTMNNEQCPNFDVLYDIAKFSGNLRHARRTVRPLLRGRDLSSRKTYLVVMGTKALIFLFQELGLYNSLLSILCTCTCARNADCRACVRAARSLLLQLYIIRLLIR